MHALLTGELALLGFILLNTTVTSPVSLLSGLICQCSQVLSGRVPYNQEAKKPPREEEGSTMAAGDTHLQT